MSARVREARVGVVQANLEKTRLTAPFDGVVAEINGELNEYVTPSPPGIATLPAVDLIDNSCFYVDAPIDEVDVAGVTMDMPARVTLDAFGKEVLPGRVRRIGDYVVDLEKQARTVEVEVAFDNPADYTRLLAGYSADVEIILDTHRDVLRVPSQALVEEKQVFVYLPDDGIVEKRVVRIGAHNWNYSEVVDGLKAGDLLVTNPDAEGLADGIAARPKETVTSP
jgi:HlyD family secretion protein